jgi:flagellar motor switch protein FliN/FliY
MTEIPGPELTPELRAWLETWKTCVEQVLSQVSGQTMAFEISAEPLPAADSDLWYAVTAGGAAQGEMAMRLAADSAVRLAQRFLGETEPTGGPSAEHKEALEELLRQIAGQAATALAAPVGGEVQFQLAAAAAAPAWPAASTACLRTRDEAGTLVIIEIQISAALVTALQAAAEAKAAAASAPTATPTAAPVELPPEAASYQRLMDVGLEVKLRFGSRRMVLRDVLALSAGIVVELECNVNAPVDLLLDGRTIAQGEVVVVDGKYGLRVTQVLDPRPPA